MLIATEEQRQDQRNLIRDKIRRVAAWARTAPEWAPIEYETEKQAVALIDRFMSATGMRFHPDAVPYYISSDGTGGVCFEWWLDKYTLTLYQHADGTNSMLLAWGADIVTEMKSFEQPTDAQMASAWRSLYFEPEV